MFPATREACNELLFAPAGLTTLLSLCETPLPQGLRLILIQWFFSSILSNAMTCRLHSSVKIPAPLRSTVYQAILLAGRLWLREVKCVT